MDMPADHPFQHEALPSGGGRMEDAFGALREAISCAIAVSLSGAYVQVTGSEIVGVIRSCRMLPRAILAARLLGHLLLVRGPR